MEDLKMNRQSQWLFEAPPVPKVTMEPVPSTADFVDLAREILRKRLDRKQGVVLSIVHMSSSGDTEDLIDRRTEKGKSGRQVLKNPPAHLVMPPEVYEIEWKPKRGKPQKIQFVWVLSNEKSAFPVGGILFLTTVQINSFYLATFNVGALDAKICTNIHHAEMQATRFIVEQPKTWRERVGTIDIWNLSRKTGLGYSPCNPCCVDLARFLTDLRALRGLLRRASITWLTLYDRNKPCGHPTDAANLREMARVGWQLNGPGWSVIRQQPKKAKVRQQPKKPEVRRVDFKPDIVTARILPFREFFNDRKAYFPADLVAGQSLLLSLTNTAHEAATKLKKWMDNPVKFGLGDLKNALIPTPKNMGKVFSKAILGSFVEIVRANQAGDIAKVRGPLYRQYISGVVKVLTDRNTSLAPINAAEEYFFDLGQTRAKSLSTLQKYQLALALLESFRINAGRRGDWGIDQPQQWSVTGGDYQRHWDNAVAGRLVRGFGNKLLTTKRLVDNF